MRGLPPLQALLLLIALVVLGFAGSRYIAMGKAMSPQVQANDTLTDQHTIRAEIEFIFSSPPLSYTLITPSATGAEDQIILQSTSPIENPCYGTVQLVSHQLTTYWLDIVWPEDAEDGARHFVQIHISPEHGESQRFSFFSNAKDMNETFEYHTGDHHHE